MPTDPGERLARLRRLLGLSQGELSAMTGISQSHLSLMEHRQRNLTPEVAARIASATHTPVTFFAQERPPIPAGLSFRKLASATALHTVTARFEEIERLVLELDDRVPFPQVDLPRVESHPVTDEVIEDLAQGTRKAFGVGATGPILNLTRSLERKGLIVAPIADRDEELFEKHDGLSRPHTTGARPLLTYVRGGSGDRERFTKAHELGHLVLHAEQPVHTDKLREAEAHRFAGALLLPAPDMHSEVTESVTLNGYLGLKARWGVSAQAIMYRAKDLGIISESRYKSLMVQVSYKGWRKAEPVLVREEVPILLRQMLCKKFGTPPYMKASHALGIAPELLRLWAPPAAIIEQVDAEEGLDNVVPLRARRA